VVGPDAALYWRILPVGEFGIRRSEFGDGVPQSAGKSPQPTTSNPESAPEGLPAGAWGKILAQLRQSEYQVIPAVGEHRVYRASNRAHKLRAVFGSGGIRVTVENAGPGSPRNSEAGFHSPQPAAGDGQWEWGLALTGYGYEGSVRPVPAAEPAAGGNRIEYHRGQPQGGQPQGLPLLTEWYVNDEQGLEQGFTLYAPPTPYSVERRTFALPVPLVLEMALDTDLTPRLVDGGQAILFRNAGDKVVLRYASLYVTDATGRPLPAHFELTEQATASRFTFYVSHSTHHVLRIVVDDHNAVYPLTVDPLLTSPAAKLTASDGAADDGFGYAVAISGDTVVVGAHGDDDNGDDSGSAYIFERNQGGTDNWGQVAKLTATDGATYDRFGGAVAISGDTVVVGAHQNGVGSGSAYVFKRNQGGADNWDQTAKLTATDGAGGDLFGHAVAISGDTVVVGAFGDDASSGSA
jgi:hypothetical protein